MGLSGDASMGNARAEHFPKQSTLKFNSCTSCLCRTALTYMNICGGWGGCILKKLSTHFVRSGCYKIIQKSGGTEAVSSAQAQNQCVPQCCPMTGVVVTKSKAIK